MKIRSGFVSNSSSSSFLVAHRIHGKDLEQKIKKIFGEWPKDYPIKLPDFSKHIYDTIRNEDEIKTRDDYAEYEGYDSYEDWDDGDEEILDLLDKGFTVRFCSFSDDGGEPEDYILCNSDIHYSDHELVLKQEGGY